MPEVVNPDSPQFCLFQCLIENPVTEIVDVDKFSALDFLYGFVADLFKCVLAILVEEPFGRLTPTLL